MILNQEIMQKKFDQWNTIKKKINEKKYYPKFHEREIWWCALGINIDNEQDGKNKNFERPVLILKKFNKKIILGLPITSNNKEGKYYYKIDYKGRKFNIILSQIRLLSTKRLLRRIKRIGVQTFENIQQGIKEII